MSVSLFNKDIARKWRVQAMEPLYFHVSDPDSPGGYRHFEIPEGTPGTITGNINIYYAGAFQDVCRALALDSERLKKFLEHPELFTPLRKAINYYQAANKLKGNEYLACWIQLDVQWDSVPQTDSSRRGKFFAYVPWLKLAGGK